MGHLSLPPKFQAKTKQGKLCWVKYLLLKIFFLEVWWICYITVKMNFHSICTIDIEHYQMLLWDIWCNLASFLLVYNMEKYINTFQKVKPFLLCSGKSYLITSFFKNIFLYLGNWVLLRILILYWQVKGDYFFLVLFLLGFGTKITLAS